MNELEIMSLIELGFTRDEAINELTLELNALIEF